VERRCIPVEDRIWKFVRKDPGGCWIWTGARACGYGRINIGGKKTDAAGRVIWTLIKGPIPDGMELCHDCPGGDNPACVNPEHMFLGSHAENMRDAKDKGRLPCGERHAAKMRLVTRHGEDRPEAKLTAEIVRSMRNRAAAGEKIKSLAAEFGVDNSTASVAIARKTWRHVA
jgi:hypothetical protein